MSDTRQNPWKLRIKIAVFLLIMGALIYGPLAFIVVSTKTRWRREIPPPSCQERARTLEALRLNIEAEREGIIACLRDESRCVGVYSEESLRAHQARELRSKHRYAEECTTDQTAGS